MLTRVTGPTLTLRKEVERERLAARGPRRWADVRPLVADICGQALSTPLLAVGLLGIAVAAIFVPTSITLEVFDVEAGTNTFLGTLWQVEAAAVGLSFAAILFLFQSFSQGVLRVPLRESIYESKILPFLYLGLGSLFVDGLVLLGYGHGAPFGWAASWATALSMFAILALLPLLA